MIRNSDFKVLGYLATVKQDRERSKYWIEKRTSLARQTVYDTIRRLIQARLIDEKVAGKSRARKPIKYYYLKEAGWIKLVHTPQSSDKFWCKLGGQQLRCLSRFQEVIDRENRQKAKKMIKIFQDLQEIDDREGAPPNSLLLLTITVDGKGQAEVGMRSSRPDLLDDLSKWVKRKIR